MIQKPLMIMTTCKGREDFAQYVIDRIPDLIVSYDDFKDSGIWTTAWLNYQRSWIWGGTNAVLYFEDDIILTSNFMEKALTAISEHPNDVINFFSMRKDDLTIGSRYIAGAKYGMNQCYYLPAGMPIELYQFSKQYEKMLDKAQAPIDWCMAEFLKRKKLKYWNHVPNLVDHRVAKSAINPKRSTKRQSFTFEP